MYKTTQGILLSVVLSLFATISCTYADSMKETVAALMESGDGTVSGTDPDYGAYLVASVTVDDAGSGSKSHALYEKAGTIAKKALAAYLGQELSSQETLDQWEKVISRDGVETIEEGSSQKSRIKAVVNQLLKGVRLEDVKQTENHLVVVYVLTEKGMSIAQSLSGNTNFKGVGNANEDNERTATVVAIGFGAISNGRMDEARQQALMSAQKDALSQVLGTIVAGTTQIQNYEKMKSKIFSNTSGFIDHYDIIEQGPLEKSYKIKMSAAVSTKKIFDSYRSFLQSMGNPPFYVDAKGDDELREKFSSFFSEMDLNITPYLKDAAYVIKLNGDFDRVKHPIENTLGTQLSVWINLYDPNAGELLFTIKNDPRKAAVFYGNDKRQHDLAIKKAFSQIKKPLHEKLNETIVTMAQSGRTVKIVFDNYSSTYAEKLPDIQRIIDMVPGVSDSNYTVNDIRMELVFKVKYTGKMDSLQEFMLGEMSKELPRFMRPNLERIGANELLLAF